jgi:DNA helicase-2/ATP-dependent DNA helicase PcrA
MKLNLQQETAANAIDGVWVVIAGPGSGKTTVMVERYIRMLSKGVNTRDILNLTFTNSAAEQMQRRVGLTDSKSAFRTFHSFAIEVLKRERDHLPFDLCDEVIPVKGQDHILISELCKQFRDLDYKKLRERITNWKCQNITPERASDEANGQIECLYALGYEEYEKKMRMQGWLDFDACIKETVRLFETNEGVRNRWKRKYISVDECQDTSVEQFRLLQLLFDGNIFVVGDENQLIFSWRDAQEGNLTKFNEKFPGAKTLYLGQNYRSSRALVSFFKEILPVDNGIASFMTSDNEEGVEPTIIEYEYDLQEAERVLSKITDPEHTAIIARTNRQLFPFQKACTTKGIKYKFLGKDGFWQQPEVKRLLKLAKESKDTRPANEVLTDLIRDHNLLWIYRHQADIDNDPARNLNDAIRMSAGKGDVTEFLNYLRRLTYATKAVKCLTLSTVHQAKGREYDKVYFVGVSQGRLPHRDGEINEERRIWFVGCSRAAKYLEVSYFGSRSEFLNNYIDKIQINLADNDWRKISNQRGYVYNSLKDEVK